MDKEKRFEAMTALIAEKVGVPVFDIAGDAAHQSRLQIAIDESGTIGNVARPSARCLGGSTEIDRDTHNFDGGRDWDKAGA